jgi:hypothetical protein
MEERTAKELQEIITVRMNNPKGVYLTVAPDPSCGWHVTASAAGEAIRAINYNQIAQEIAAELRQKYSLKI